MTKLPPGKVPWRLISDHVSAELPPGVLLGPAHGEDAALVRVGGEIWAVSSDPITFTSQEAGRLAVIVNANDVAVRGAVPLYFTAVLLVAPEEADSTRIGELLDQVRSACAELGIALIGGHTEVTPDLEHTLVAGTMLGKVTGRPLTTGGLRPGDAVGMTRSAGLEGTAILASKFAPLFGERPVESSLCVVKEALASAASAHVTALHDVTEGGVGEALHEMACAAKLTIDVEASAIPVLEETRGICEQLGMNPLGLIGSGSLLVGCGEAGRSEVEERLASLGVPFTWIGRAVAGEPRSTVARFERDEILKAWLLAGVQAVVFDMDGTLIDADYDWRAIKTQLGIHGRSIIDALNGFPEPERGAKWETLRQIERKATLEARVREGAADLLTLLRSHGLKTALVTNNSEDNVQYLLEKFGLAFDVVLSRDSGLYKPSGAPVAEAVRRLGVSPARTLCVGDSRYDVLAAREAGCAWVCILYDAEKRFSPEADIDFPDIAAFRRYLGITLRWE
ncbi:MAG: HAD-IA family hydrolase [Planctomycetota bacterium]